jgi:transposase
MVDAALSELQAQFEAMYAQGGRPSIPPEKLLRALLLQLLYTVRSERQLMEQLDYNLLFRWFVGLSMDDPVWDVSVFTKNRERLLDAELAQRFFNQVVTQARAQGLISAGHFTVDGTLIEAWAGQKSFQRTQGKPTPPRTTPGTRASTSAASGDAMRPINRPPTRKRACIRRLRGARPSSAISAIC